MNNPSGLHSGQEAPERLKSLDILRGFDMFWIVGGGSLVIAIHAGTGWSWMQPVAEQMSHVEWEGFRFWDLIFPLFMFITGVVIPYSLISKIEKGASRTELLKKTVKRGMILVLLGIVYNGALRGELVDIRFVSVLGQIGLSYMFAAIIFMYTGSFRVRLLWLTGIMIFVAFLQLFVPAPGFEAGLAVPAETINAWLDRALVPGRLAYGNGEWDALGPLEIISSISLALMGGLAGSILRDGKPANMQKTIKLGITGSMLILLAIIISPWYPVIKVAWTTSYSILTGGISFVLLALFYFVIDVKKWTEGMLSPAAFFFKVIGMNSITIYMAARIINFYSTSGFLLGWLEVYWGRWVIVTGVITLEWLLLWYMYKRKIFLKI
jgi:predicted acyltransferase